MNHDLCSLLSGLLFSGLTLAWIPEAAAADPSPGPAPQGAATPLRLARFDVDATPPVGSHLAYDPVTNVWDLTLRARGVVLLGAGEPIVLCALDWIGIANEGHDAFRQTLAEAAGTSAARVAVHTVHQHDAPECDFGAEEILKKAGLPLRNFDGEFAREILRRLDRSVRQALPQAQDLTHVGLGEAPVQQVASTRRILGPDGKVRVTRYTSCADPEVRAEPEGTIDPTVSVVSFWSGSSPLAVLSYYAVHPQSYYRLGIANPDFPGVARFFRQLAVPTALHVHFNGAGGNLGAGKYNDGSPANRRLLAERLADGMKRAWDATVKEPIAAEAVGWSVEPVALLPAQHLDLEKLQARLDAKDTSFIQHAGPSKLAWLRRSVAGHKTDVTCLRLGSIRIVHLPGEPFVEYQLAAKAERRDLHVVVAAYGDYGPGYLATAIAYEQGGYETSPDANITAPGTERILLDAIRKLLASP